MKAINPDRAQFAQLVAACGDGPVPFTVRLPNDLCTPVGSYARIAAKARYAFFLESVELGKRLGRYSFMGANPQRTFVCRDGKFSELDASGQEISSCRTDDPLQQLEGHWRKWQARWPKEVVLPPLAGGMVGYMGYDCVHSFEPLGEVKPDAIGMPEMVFMIPETTVCFDHLHAEVLLTFCLPPGHCRGKDTDGIHDQLLARAEQAVAEVMAPAGFAPPGVQDCFEQRQQLPAELASNFEPDRYKDVVKRAKRHIQAGDIFQIVPSQRFSCPLKVDPLQVYRRLRKINPSQYMFVLKIDDCTALGSSPEMQLQVTGGRMQMRPIAGTRPRGDSQEQDQALAAELLADEKEVAEHRMLVDLARNDLGRVARTGSVQIDWLMRPEFYSHVIHITSAVSGQLDQERFSIFDALRSTFPAGTLSGAPKVRAMQLINEFEPVRRNLYGGLVGYVDLRGNVDTCIAIRMMIASGGTAHVQAGGGIVADSDPDAELNESRRKAQAVLRAIAEAQAK